MDKKDTIALAVLHKAWFQQKDLERLSEHTESFDETLSCFTSWQKPATPWIRQDRLSKILETLPTIDHNAITSALDRLSIHVVTKKDAWYPEKLRWIPTSPFALYIRWRFEEKKLTIGIVGSRKNTSYGQRVLEQIIPSLVVSGICVVSGGAYGIDSISHALTLDHGGYTVSVFGCWVDVTYPVYNSALFDRIIASGGALISCFPIGAEAETYMFPVRNVIVAGLSDGVVVPEAALWSGTLITAGLALDHGKDVFALPGDIFRETSAGTNMLIATGQAKCITSATGILEEYFGATPERAFLNTMEKEFDTIEEKTLYRNIKEWYTTPDLLSGNTDYSIDVIVIHLSLLEMNGHIKLGSGGKYELI